MKTINPYLNFCNDTEKAFNFYRQVFGGKFTFMQRFKEVPPEARDGTFSDNEGEKIMHVALPMGKSTLMASDIPEKMAKDMDTCTSFSISISADSKEEVDKIFKKLSSGGKVDMPVQDMFWGDYFGMLTDRFGISWMIGFTKPK